MSCETLSKPTKKQFDTAEVIKWRCQQVTSTREGTDRERFEKARALKAKLEATEKSKTFVRTDLEKYRLNLMLSLAWMRLRLSWVVIEKWQEIMIECKRLLREFIEL